MRTVSKWQGVVGPSPIAKIITGGTHKKRRRGQPKQYGNIRMGQAAAEGNNRAVNHAQRRGPNGITVNGLGYGKLIFGQSLIHPERLYGAGILHWHAGIDDLLEINSIGRRAIPEMISHYKQHHNNRQQPKQGSSDNYNG
jgi:hypothetical protein